MASDRSCRQFVGRQYGCHGYDRGRRPGGSLGARTSGVADLRKILNVQPFAEEDGVCAEQSWEEMFVPCI